MTVNVNELSGATFAPAPVMGSTVDQDASWNGRLCVGNRIQVDARVFKGSPDEVIRQQDQRIGQQDPGYGRDLCELLRFNMAASVYQAVPDLPEIV